MMKTFTARFTDVGYGSPKRSPMGRAFGGFVLIEVIVVAVIVGILAAVAIPIYTGMVTSQKNAVAKNIAQSVAVSANVYFRRYGEPTCPDITACVTLLGLFLNDASKYTMVIGGGVVTVTDISTSIPQSVPLH